VPVVMKNEWNKIKKRTGKNLITAAGLDSSGNNIYKFIEPIIINVFYLRIKLYTVLRIDNELPYLP